MSEVKDAQALLVMALQDLHDGEAALVERLPEVRGSACDLGFRRFIDADRARSERQRGQVAGLTRALDAEPQDEPNIWQRAILDDAANDARTIISGHLRDIALIGALRKAKQAERVSYETAIALAKALKLRDGAGMLTAIRDEEQAADEELASLLKQLVGEAGTT